MTTAPSQRSMASSLLTLLAVVVLIAMLQIMQTMATSASTPLHDPAADSKSRSSRTSEDGEDTGHPWWLWLAVGAGAVFLIITIFSTFACYLVCRVHNRDRSGVAGNDEHTLVSLRKVSEASAVRHLKDIVSVGSWGSDFEPRDATRPKTVIYSVPQTSRSAAAASAPGSRKPTETPGLYANTSSSQYANVSSSQRLR